MVKRDFKDPRPSPPPDAGDGTLAPVPAPAVPLGTTEDDSVSCAPRLFLFFLALLRFSSSSKRLTLFFGVRSLASSPAPDTKGMKSDPKDRPLAMA